MNNMKASILAMMMQGELIGNEENSAEYVCIDSRDSSEGKLFFPIIGEKVDAHKFIEDVFKSGCNITVCERSHYEKAKKEGFAWTKDKTVSIIVVDDTIKALQKLAYEYIKKLDIIKVAVTGSVGKTTTRDMIRAGLSAKYQTKASMKNFNSDIGLPVAVLALNDDDEACVLEMGMSAFGEIHELAKIVRPDIAVITNIGVSHIENLGSRDGIFRAKMEITDFFTEKHTLVINADDDKLSQINNTKYSLVKVGHDDKSDFVISNIHENALSGVKFEIKRCNRNIKVNLDYPGTHNAVNAGLALAVCEILGVDEKKAIRKIESLELTSNRLSIQKINGINLIDDSYNAAPASMISALKTLGSIESGRKIAILAGMNELGDFEQTGHEKVGRTAFQEGIDTLITIGEKAAMIEDGAKKAMLEIDEKHKKDSFEMCHFDTKEELCAVLRTLIKNGDSVLIKGSRTFELEKVGDVIKREFS